MRELQAMWSQNYATEIRHSYAVRRLDNAMPCHKTGKVVPSAAEHEVIDHQPAYRRRAQILALVQSAG